MTDPLGASGTSTKPKLEFSRSTNDSKVFKSPRSVLRKMFEKQDGDWEMVASDGKVYKFDSFVLSEQVDHFRAILAHPGTTEHVNQKVIVPAELEMTGAAVEAFLRFVYYQDKAPIRSSFDIACALIRAGHYYDIPEMVDTAYDVIAGKCSSYEIQSDWFNFEDLWKLYQLIWLWEESHPSRKKLMKKIGNIIKRGFKNEAVSMIVSTPRGDVLKDFISDLIRETPTPEPYRQEYDYDPAYYG